MYLTKLKINGFKSFAQKVELKFNQGITAIVGPNGSGKSNIADAIRWSLGEQSIKSIRGKKTSDIIFAGSDKKSRLSLAEVGLYLNNEDGSAPIDFSEISLVRRFYRSGDGEYLLNDSKVRLSDIQILLAKANIGSKTYSVIGQGQIDAVLTATLAERKDFFDEATGVKQFQIKREQALHKLEKTWTNLKQGNLMLTEIEPRLRSLTRQVKRLEQKEEVEKELKSLQNFYYYNIWSNQFFNQNDLKEKKKNLIEKKAEFEKNYKVIKKQIDNLAIVGNQVEEFSDLQSEYQNKQIKKQELLRKLAVWEGKRDLALEKSSGGEILWAKKRLEKLLNNKSEYEKNIIELKKTETDFVNKIQDVENSYQQVIDSLENIEQKLQEQESFDNNELATKEIDLSLRDISKNLESLQSDFSQTKNLDNILKWKDFIGKILNKINSIITHLPNKEENNEQKQKLQEKYDFLQKQKIDLSGKIYELKAEKNVIFVKINNITNNLNKTIEEIDQLADFKQKISHEDISQKEKELKETLRILDEEMLVINTKLQDFNRGQQEKKEKLFSLQDSAQGLQMKISHIDSDINRLDVELAKIETRLEDLALEVHRELNIFLASLIDDWKKQPPHREEDFISNDILEKINSLKKKKEMIGGTPPETLAEYKEVKEKYDFLMTQANDLTESITKLTSTIDELDEIVYKQFTKNFEQIKEFFNRYFRMLFSGGRAELTLIKSQKEEIETQTEESEEDDEDDLLKKYKNKGIIEGVDIKATPPGKKMKNISMLSGGERALTSIALICSMIANNPSPFVVLDEVDAALDEANSLRFSEILAELSKKTQFIVITHNRATMEKADIIYGVTMGSDGISSLLSVKFDEAEKFANRY